jgi:hypothetical protein
MYFKRGSACTENPALQNRRLEAADYLSAALAGLVGWLEGLKIHGHLRAFRNSFMAVVSPPSSDSLGAFCGRM